MTLHSRLLCAAAVAALLFPVAAQADSGFYLGGNLGMGFPTDSSLSNGTNSNDAEIDPGFAGILAAGWQFANGVRLQGEFAARLNQVGEITGTGAAAPFDGSMNVYSFMADAIYGIPTGTKFTPYIGAGAGIARVSANDIGTTLTTTVDDDDTVFAYQAIAGVEYAIHNNLFAGLDYRYFRTADTEFTSAAATSVTGDYENHTVTLGLRYLFPKAAPMPAPAVEAKPMPVAEAAPPAPPMVPNNYIVFFDFAKSSLTPEADRIVAAAAANAAQARATTLEVTGHADRSGSDRFNMRLSQRRADVVRQALIAKGVPADAIAVLAKGESQPLVPTADGVREAQNRRVQIILK